VRFNHGLTLLGETVASGAAYGIDTVALSAALDAGGTPIAFVASDLDQLFPSGNTELLETIGRTGAVVSERSPGTPPHDWRFLRRNQVLGALSSKTIVVEASAPSGAIATATTAISLGRPVGVVPGSVGDPRWAGGSQLLEDDRVVPVLSAQEAAAL